MAIGDRHAQTSLPRRTANRCRAAGATSRQAAPAEQRPSAHGAGAAAPATARAENLEGSRSADKLQAITELDLEELRAVDPPRGYGRD
jgi:hypothetical protein